MKKQKTEDSAPLLKGCLSVVLFFIVTLLGMFLILYIKKEYFDGLW